MNDEKEIEEYIGENEIDGNSISSTTKTEKGKKIQAKSRDVIDEYVKRFSRNPKSLPGIDELKKTAICLSKESGGAFKIDYNNMNASEIVHAILEYNKKIQEKTSSNCLPERAIAAIEAKKKMLIEEGKWIGEEGIKRMEQRQAIAKTKKTEKKNVTASLNPFTAKIPKWLFLDGKDSFAREISIGGEQLIIAQLEGDEAIVLNSSCSTYEDHETGSKKNPPTKSSCAIFLTVGKISKTIGINATLDSFLIDKNRLMSIINKDEIKIVAKDDNDISKKNIMKVLVDGEYFKDIENIFVERMTMKIVKGRKVMSTESIKNINVNETPLKKSAILDAGKVFMFEMLFGLSNGSNEIIKRNIKNITKVYTNPGDIRIKKIIDNAEKQAQNMIKNKAELQFLKTETILDDALFIQGMNDTRLKIIANGDTTRSIINLSNLKDEEKKVLSENINKIESMSIADFIEMTFSENSPLKHKTLKCQRQTIGEK